MVDGLDFSVFPQVQVEIYDMIEYAMSHHTVSQDADLKTILAARDDTDRILTEHYGV